MANISTSTSCSVSFTDEEKKILQKASEICKTIGREIWHDGNDTDEEDQAAFSSLVSAIASKMLWKENTGHRSGRRMGEE